MASAEWVRIKFRARESPMMRVGEEMEFVVTYHAHCFDKVKVDGEIYLCDPETGTAVTGTATLTFKFSPLLLPGEDLSTPLPTADEAAEAAALESIYTKYTGEDEDGDDDDDDDDDFQDASDVMDPTTSDETYISTTLGLVDRLATRREFLRAATMNSLTGEVETTPPPTNDPRPTRHLLRRKSTTSQRSASTGDTHFPRTPPRLMTENASHNLSEISHMMLGMLKHEFPLTSHQLVRSTRLLYRFENGLPLPRTGRIVKDVDHARLAVRFMKHALCVYGALVLGFCNGTMRIRDNVRVKADEKTAAEYLGLRVEDFLYWDRSRREIGKAKYYVCWDWRVEAVVVCCQGTIHLTQILTDLNAEYFPVQDGAAHRGILRAAQSILDAHLPSLLTWCRDLKAKKLICTGHSLGGGTAALLTILLNERLDEFRKVTGLEGFEIRGACIATPAVADVREMILEANRLIDQKVPEEEAYQRLHEKRVEILKSNHDTRGMIPGRVYHIYKTVRKIPRRHHKRLDLQTSLFEKAYKTVNLPPEEHPEIPHYVMELARPEFFAFVAPRRHIFNHHLPWAYSKGVWGVLEWLEEGEREREGRPYFTMLPILHLVRDDECFPTSFDPMNE
ncbi:hypothetical protein HDU67_008981 [Dinochytrium kinnereticum]|nr:hypothetical protein HDU67_008981 [Dinochytrium kinnereticum]